MSCGSQSLVAHEILKLMCEMQGLMRELRYIKMQEMFPKAEKRKTF